MTEEIFLDDRAFINNIEQSALFDRIIGWLSSEKKVRIIEQRKPYEVRFMYEKTFGFYEGFGKPFLITLTCSGTDVEVRVQVPFPTSSYPEFFTRVKPLIMYLALEDIYRNIGVILDDEVLKRVFPKPALKALMRSSIEVTIAAGVVVLVLLCAFIYALGLQIGGEVGYLIALMVILFVGFATMMWYLVKSNGKYRRYKAMMKQLYG